jgi:hypothetical protein
MVDLLIPVCVMKGWTTETPPWAMWIRKTNNQNKYFDFLKSRWNEQEINSL